MINIDFGKAHPNLKSLLIFIILVPFWYITLHIFHPHFFYKNDLILKICYCVCLSLSSSFLYTKWILESEQENNESVGFFDVNILVLSTIIQISWQSLLIFIFYIYAEIRSEIVIFSTFFTVYIFPGLAYNFYSLFERLSADKSKKT